MNDAAEGDGVGLGNSVQKQFYLPEAHTDFVFSVLAEELGVVGSLLTVALFVFVCVRGMYIGMWAERAKQYFSAYMAYGLSFLWIGQFLINIGVNVGLLPRWVRLSHSMRSNKPIHTQQITNELPP